ncbi:MAG: FAD-dependent oxidoreductase [Deltaproteobacteria bacterium]|nr:FAD-dependent oxidoreductase [Deltaproteobacteria bacterium]
MAPATENHTNTRRPLLTLQQAVAEAHRCLLCHDAPCSKGCPGGTDPGTFIRQLRFYNLKGAARTVLRNNPLGGTCAAVCPVESTCVRECLRSGIDRPIDIDGLQAFAVAYGRQHGVRALARGAARKEKVAIVGAGPAGLTAAARLAQLGYPVTLFEARPKAGGMLRYGVPPSRFEEHLLDADLEEILGLGIELRTGSPIQGDDGAAHLLEQDFQAVFVAPGLWRSYRLEVPGSELKGVTTALEFLADVHNDAAKAAALVKGRNIAIVGGGSVAMDVARCCRELGAGRIYAIALESMTELPAQPDELDQALKDGVIIKPQCQVARIVPLRGLPGVAGAGDEVAGVEGHETEWIEPGKLVPQNARPVEGTGFKLRVGAVIQAIGQGPTDEIGKILTQVKKSGPRWAVDEATQATAVNRVYAGGDVVRGAGTVVQAVADGKRAADAIHALLDGKERA